MPTSPGPTGKPTAPSRFRDGDRVIVKRDDGDSQLVAFTSKFIDLTGFYGHVRGRYDDKVCDIFVPVVFEGCLPDAPDREHAADVIDGCRMPFDSDGNVGKPFPCYVHELEHID